MAEYRKVKFPLVKNGTLVVYPDDMSLFKNTKVKGAEIIGLYAGSLPLDAYVEPQPLAPSYTYDELKKILDIDILSEMIDSNDANIKKMIEKLREGIPLDLNKQKSIDAVNYMVAAASVPLFTQATKDALYG